MLENTKQILGVYPPPVFLLKSAEEYDCKGVVENTGAKEFVRV